MITNHRMSSRNTLYTSARSGLLRRSLRIEPTEACARGRDALGAGGVDAAGGPGSSQSRLFRAEFSTNAKGVFSEP